MIISEEGKFIFVHVQKNAGMSIEKMLMEYFPDARHWHGRHGHAKDGIEEIGLEAWNDYFSFAFVRNPWDRLVSWYTAIQAQFNRLPPERKNSDSPFTSPFWNHAVQEAHDFESFIENCTHKIFDRGCLKSYAFNQSDYLIGSDGVPVVDFIGRFENLATDLNYIFSKLGLENFEIKKVNTSNHDHYSNYYSKKSKQIISNRFKADIKRFGFKFTED